VGQGVIEESEAGASQAAAQRAAAIGMATSEAARDASVAEESRAFLREQVALAKLQKQNLLDQNAFELSHLRWRRFNDQMKGAMQMMTSSLLDLNAADTVALARMRAMHG